MKDIDFDELDKAVNSLMGKNSQKDTNIPAAPPVNEPDMPLTAAPMSPGTIKPKSEVATNPDTQPVITPSQPVSQSQATSPARSGMPASRRSGRFMDVVPKKAAQQPPSRPASREGVAIAPRPDVEPSTVSSAPAVSLPIQPTTPVSSTPESKPITPEADAPVSDWPDPIDMHSFAKPKETPAPAATPVSEKSEPEEMPIKQPEEEKQPVDQPLSSPFLPGAKVEKRPLGSAASMVPMIAPEHELQTAAPDDSAAQLPAKPSDVKEPPEEFRGDLMQVEADTHMGVPKTDQTHPIDEEPENEKIVAPDLTTQEKSSKIEEMPESTETSVPEEEKTSPEAHVGRISIPQQYKEQPSTGEKESGAIYDTDTYHQPLAHPAKKKSGWLWVLWIVLILIVGAGAGVALYFLGII